MYYDIMDITNSIMMIGYTGKSLLLDPFEQQLDMLVESADPASESMTAAHGLQAVRNGGPREKYVDFV